MKLDFADAKTYQTPLGPQPRTPELVRAAVAALRDPYRRLVAELWARNAPPPRQSRGAGDRTTTAVPKLGLRRALGWRP
jgi:hypothetical protein